MNNQDEPTAEEIAEYEMLLAKNNLTVGNDDKYLSLIMWAMRTMGFAPTTETANRLRCIADLIESKVGSIPVNKLN